MKKNLPAIWFGSASAAVFLILSSCSPNFSYLEPGRFPFPAVKVNLVTLTNATPISSVATAIGNNTPTGLTVFKIRINEMSLVKNLTVSSSGSMVDPDPRDVFKLYDKGQADYSAFSVNDAKTSDKDYIDLMSPASVASNFGQPVQVDSKALGSYNGFTCGFFAQIKIKAVIPIPGGSNLYTKSGTYSSSGSQVVASSSLKNSPAEESVIQLASAGTWFRLLKPFVITQKDIDNKTNFNLLIAFNPDKLLQGLADATGAQSGPLLVDGTNSITMGLFNLTAVPYRQGEVVVRETYTAHYVSSPNDNQVRLEIYTIKSDSGNIYAATEQEYADSTALLAPQGIFPFNSAAESGGKISLIAASGTAIVSNFTRQTSVGGSTAAYYKGVSTTFTLKEIKEVN